MKGTTPIKEDEQAIVSPPNRPAKKMQKKNPPDFSDPSALVTFFIGGGDNPKQFIIHKQNACYHSPVLNAAFNSVMIEGQTQTYRLDNASIGAFQLLSQWLYSEKLQLIQLRDDWPATKDRTIEQCLLKTTENMSLAEVWVLADELMIPRLQNAALERINAISDKVDLIADEPFEYIYRNTGSGSLLRRYITDMCVYRLAASAFSRNPDRFPHELLIDVAIVIANANGLKYASQISEYYVPVDNE